MPGGDNACFRLFSRCGTGHDQDVWVQWDCCGWICAIFTWALLGYACFAFNTALVPFLSSSYFGQANLVVFNAFIFLAYWSHVKAMLTDPGAVPREALPLDFYENGAQLQAYHNVCKKCQHFKPARAHHCSICQRCVVRMDHHCPWINNCVGVSNHKFFILFCFYVMLSAVHANGLLLYRLLHCARHSTLNAQNRLIEPEYCTLPGGYFIMLIFLCIEALLFGLFTMCMLCDQYSVVFSAQTQVERLKAEAAAKQAAGRAKSTAEFLADVFGGEGVSVEWLIPVQARWKSHEKVYQWMLPKPDVEAALEEGTLIASSCPAGSDTNAGKPTTSAAEESDVHERHGGQHHAAAHSSQVVAPHPFVAHGSGPSNDAKVL